jgi:hypothetical protein
MKAEISFLTPFDTGLSQHARLITLASAQQRGLPESLVAEQFAGREAVNALFSFEVEALSVSTDLDLSLFTVAIMEQTQNALGHVRKGDIEKAASILGKTDQCIDASRKTWRGFTVSQMAQAFEGFLKNL